MDQIALHSFMVRHRFGVSSVEAFLWGWMAHPTICTGRHRNQPRNLMIIFDTV